METIRNIYLCIKNSERAINVFVFIFFILLPFFLLRGIIFSPGLIIGEDIAYPLTSSQIKGALEQGIYTWNMNDFIPYRNLYVGAALSFQSFQFLLSLIGVSGEFFIKAFIVFVFFFSGFSMYCLLRFFKLSLQASLAGGIFYILTPLFFNYAIFGWHFVLFVMGLLPLSIIYFVKSVQQNKVKYAIITGIIYAVAFLQSQSIVWFPMVFVIFGIYLIKNKKTFLIYLKMIIIICSLFFLLNSHTILSLLVIPDNAISGTSYINASASLGTAARLYPINIIRLWGSLFNYQYETLINNSNTYIISFLPALLVVISLFFKNKRKLTITFLVISLIPLLAYYASKNRDIFLGVPFANVFRDFARFTIFSTLAYSVIIAIFINNIFVENVISKKRSIKNIILCILVVTSYFYLTPWRNGEITKWENRSYLFDSRLKTQTYPQEYFDTENELVIKKLDNKVLYLPYSFNYTVKEKDSPKYSDGIRDIFAIYSPIRGILSTTDRGLGPVNYSDIIIGAIDKENRMPILKQSNIGYFILRKNLVNVLDDINTNKNEEYINGLNKDVSAGLVDEYFKKNNMVIYKVNEFLPHFYTSNEIIVSQRTINSLFEIISSEDIGRRTSIFFSGQNVGKVDKIKSLSNSKVYEDDGKNNKIESKKELPILEFKKINPTKYRVRVHSANGKFPLVFSESFHEGWKAYLAQGVKIPLSLPLGKGEELSKYKILDGNEDDQASLDELKEFIGIGLVTDLGDPSHKSGIFGGAGGKEKIIEHKKWEDNKEKLDYIEKYNIDFISKNFQGTIQNDNLPSGNIWETWLPKQVKSYKVESYKDKFKSLFEWNGNVMELPDEDHLMVNGYANAWIVDSSKVCKVESYKVKSDGAVCVRNADGSYDMEIIVEFWPQRLFYVGLGISGTTLLCCVFYLGYDYYRRKKSKRQAQIIKSN